MLRLPQHELAEINIAKLRDYCLSSTHPRGRHKARIFRAALGITEQDASWLHDKIKAALPAAEVTRQDEDEYGQRWQVDFLAKRQTKQTMVRTIWLIDRNGNPPRLITCWVL